MNRKPPTEARRMKTPFGTVLVEANPEGISALRFLDHDEDSEFPEPRADAITLLDRAEAQLDAYFENPETSFDLPLAPEGTRFQHAVWRELRAIPCAETRSYADLARTLDKPNAARAVGRANATNPIAILIPCHRVIRTDGSLCGYAYGIDRKRRLLDHERASSPLFA